MNVRTPRQMIDSGEWPRRAPWAKFVDAIENPSCDWERFKALREFYKLMNTNEWIPYPVDWMRVFTPIERDVWGDMRSAGIFMWPQYPAGRYFLDFADPKLRIAIECDGKDWHDEEADMSRDAELRALGWTVYRVPGSACKRTITPDFDALEYSESTEGNGEVRYWLAYTSEGLVAAIARHYFGNGYGAFTDEDAMDALRKHSSRAAPFTEDA